jgi:hypothetical protein
MGPYEAENYDAFVGEYERMAQRRRPIRHLRGGRDAKSG